MAMAVAAPACLAQQAATDAEPAQSRQATGVRTDSPSASEQPRSAFGKVMSVLITALKENAGPGTPTSLEPAALEQDLRPRSSAKTATVPDIQVGSAFRLDAQRARPDPLPATASID